MGKHGFQIYSIFNSGDNQANLSKLEERSSKNNYSDSFVIMHPSVQKAMFQIFLYFQPCWHLMGLTRYILTKLGNI